MTPRDSGAPVAANFVGHPVAVGTLLAADASLEWFADEVVAGGSPWRMVKLTPHGAQVLARWAAGDPVDEDPAERALARRLVDTGLWHPVTTPRAPVDGELDVVIPVRDNADGVAALLDSLGPLGAVLVTVVDDGSNDAAGVARVAAAHGARLVRRERPGGPAAARNDGLAATSAPLVAFLDADVLAGPDVLASLIAQFDDPCVAAAAPRVRGPQAVGSAGSPRARFEGAASPLDLGPRRCVVRPGAAVPYVPSAALLVRRTAVGRGFDEQLRVGEDVDLVWRLATEGWLVRYQPEVVVTHEVRTTWGGWLAQRFSYGRSAAILEARHGDAAAPLRADPRVLATVGLVLAGRPRAAAGVLAWSAAALGRRLGEAGIAIDESAARRLALRGTVLAAPGLVRGAFRTYGPLAIAAAVAVSPLRRPVAALAVSATALRWWQAGRPPHGVEFAAVSLVDDLAYGVGVLDGAVRARRVGALVPRLRPTARRVSRT